VRDFRNTDADLDDLRRELARIPVRPAGSAASPGGSQMVRFTLITVDCDAHTATGIVSNVMCEGADAAVGDSITLTDPLSYLIGNPALLEGHVGFAVKMVGSEYDDCDYEIVSMDDLGYNC
jgi:hypothetical protein